MVFNNKERMELYVYGYPKLAGHSYQMYEGNSSEVNRAASHM